MMRNAALVCVALLVGAPTVAAMGYGVNMSATGEARSAGWTPQYGQFWIGDWSNGKWSYLENQLYAAKAQGVTPVIEWYYWGDSISPNCVRNGCNGLSSGEWWSMGDTLSKKVRSIMGDKPVIIVVETEFNKGGIQDWEEFDGRLASHIAMLKKNAPNAKIALGFGNWGYDKFDRFDRAMGASHYSGIQLMRGVTKDSWTSYKAAPDVLVSGARALKSTFGKPIIVHDIALASYNALDAQNDVVKGIADRRGTLESLGVFGLVYRDIRDYSDACTCWYYGAAERTFGLKYSGGGAKPAWHTWSAMAKGGSSSIPASSSSGSSSSGSSSSTDFATFTPKNGNSWWVQVSVSSSKSIGSVDARVNGGSWVSLTKHSYGWAKSIHAPAGSVVDFRAKATDGSTDWSPPFTWLSGTSTSSSTSGSTTFTPKNGNEWWVQTSVSSSKSISTVEARVNGGSWIGLTKYSWGWAKSIHASSGSGVEFRAKATDGSYAYSTKYTWPVR